MKIKKEDLIKMIDDVDDKIDKMMKMLSEDDKIVSKEKKSMIENYLYCLDEKIS